MLRFVPVHDNPPPLQRVSSFRLTPSEARYRRRLETAMIDKEIIAEANALARDFYDLMGYGVPKGSPKCWPIGI
jgi:hypothetical protein